MAKLAPTEKLGEYMGWLNTFFSLPQFMILIFGGILIDAGFAPYLYVTASIILAIGFIAALMINMKSTKTIALKRDKLAIKEARFWLSFSLIKISVFNISFL